MEREVPGLAGERFSHAQASAHVETGSTSPGQGPAGSLTFRDSFRGIKIWCLAFTSFLRTKRMPRRSWRKLFSSGGIPGVVEENKMIDNWLVCPGGFLCVWHCLYYSVCANVIVLLFSTLVIPSL